MNKNEIIKKLKLYSNPKNVAGMARFGINPKNTLGVTIPILRKMAREIGKDHKLARELWKSGIHEARILASMVDDPKLVTEKQMDNWIKDFDSWDVCDQVCMNLFAKLPERSPSEAPQRRRGNKTPFAFVKAIEWANSPHFAKAPRGEYQKRAGFALMACLAWHDKKTADREFAKFFPAINKASIDDRNLVKKAVNWALRQIGKRNKNLCQKAMKIAREIEKINSKSARWIAKNAIRELKTKFK